MNKCSFLGKFSDIKITTENQIEKVTIVLSVENKRKSTVKKMDYESLAFEAWGGAAVTIYNNLKEDDYLLVIDSTARNNSNQVCFRINEFKIIKRGST